MFLRNVKKTGKGILRRNILKHFKRMMHQLGHQGSEEMEELALQESDRVLVLSPHPDDESIGCGGLLLAYPSQIEVVCLADGGGGIPGTDPASAAKLRAVEFSEAMKFAGISSWRMLKVADGSVHDAGKILETVDLSMFDVVAIPNPFDTHLDHCAIVDLIYAHHIKYPFDKSTKFLIYEVWSTVPSPNTFVDLSHSWQQKAELVKLYGSQISVIDYADRILALNRFRGMSVGCEYAEAYMVLNLESLLGSFC